MKSGNKYDYKRFVEEYFSKLGGGSCPRSLCELKSLLTSYVKPAKGASPEVFVSYMRLLVIEGPDGERLRQEHKDAIEVEFAERHGYYRLDRRLKPVFEELSEIFKYCQDVKTGPIAKKHIEAMRSQWEENESSLAAKYRIKDRKHFISEANKHLESEGSPSGSNPQGRRNPENDSSQGRRVMWDLGE